MLPIIIQDTTCFYLKHFRCIYRCLFYIKKILTCYPKPILFYRLTDNTLATQHKLQYDIGVVMQDNAKQHWWYSTILAANTISNTDSLAKTVHPDSFGEEPSSLRLRKLMTVEVVASDDDEDTRSEWQTIHSTLSLILSLLLVLT